MCRVVATRRAQCLCIQAQDVHRCKQNRDAGYSEDHELGMQCEKLVHDDQYYETSLPCIQQDRCQDPVQPDDGEELLTVQTEHGPRNCIVDARGGLANDVVYQTISTTDAPGPSQPSYRVKTDIKLMQSFEEAGMLVGPRPQIFSRYLRNAIGTEYKAVVTQAARPEELVPAKDPPHSCGEQRKVSHRKRVQYSQEQEQAISQQVALQIRAVRIEREADDSLEYPFMATESVEDQALRQTMAPVVEEVDRMRAEEAERERARRRWRY